MSYSYSDRSYASSNISRGYSYGPRGSGGGGVVPITTHFYSKKEILVETVKIRGLRRLSMSSQHPP